MQPICNYLYNIFICLSKKTISKFIITYYIFGSLKLKYMIAMLRIPQGVYMSGFDGFSAYNNLQSLINPSRNR